jgi:hypothetical protein
MKIKPLFSLRLLSATREVLLGCIVLLCVSSNAQNLLKNASFENPIDPEGSSGTTNWTVVYAYGGPGDFAYADRTSEACWPDDPTYPGGVWGAAFRINHDSYSHAYHKQIITGLTPGASYKLSGYMHCGFDNAKFDVYIAMLGGAGGTAVVSNRATDTRTKYVMVNTASTSGQIEVRVGLNKKDTFVSEVGDAKFTKSTGWFDVFSLTPTP